MICRYLMGYAEDLGTLQYKGLTHPSLIALRFEFENLKKKSIFITAHHYHPAVWPVGNVPRSSLAEDCRGEIRTWRRPIEDLEEQNASIKSAVLWSPGHAF